MAAKLEVEDILLVVSSAVLKIKRELKVSLKDDKLSPKEIARMVRIILDALHEGGVSFEEIKAQEVIVEIQAALNELHFKK